ncbi:MULTISPECIES: paraquat-inducible protein A [Lonsdalea]|uniref:Paraquat-inducible protein A n=2 Tax=Lonsdalea TaxID=1082702 RepID=A0ACD1JER1_9GAMM|nr:MULTISPECIES: paraquat-inducible protein A [Lonsdalea]RAT13931.1 paraquat-inducible protein A [Lonsdalea quercina]RAT20314.1 paraquat-inducible protein A [Lonsdalea populi]RAT21988.1 paraquat-inducible protein A [Lonsdalea populi]RAT23217.1 paraquat-inducible protein A [Lonsdalea populi]RAT34931.1 paraquat-inducible protein A [Lonsdalea populi]
MKICRHLTVCTHCDCVYLKQALQRGESARCRRCSAVLYHAAPINTDVWLAITLTAAIVWVLANVFPVLRVSFHGVQNSATLWQTAIALAQGPMLLLAVLTVLLLIVIPALQILLFGWILLSARRRHRAPGFILCMKIQERIRPWGMVEVGLLGFMIAGIKLSGFLDVLPGPGCWAMAALMVLNVVIGHRNVLVLWDYTDSQSTREVNHA